MVKMAGKKRGMTQMETFWILGAGRFGSQAAQRLRQQNKDRSLLLVDSKAEPLKQLEAESIKIIRKDAIDFLVDHSGLGHEWVVPAVPVHVAFAWLCRQLAKEGLVTQQSVPAAIEPQVPNPLRVESGALYTSFATFRCPDDCNEAAESCTITGKTRAANLFDLIGDTKVEGYEIRVLRSHQLAPGVGGYQLSALWRLLEDVRWAAAEILVATACRCHGVIDALRFDRKAHGARF
jgi:hypothetical protein